MRKLDRSRPFGIISPPYAGESGEFSRAAWFEQDGKLYDGQGFDVEGPLEQKAPAPRKREVSPLGNTRAPADVDAIRSPTELLEREGELPLSALRRRAAIILSEMGEPACPANATRDQIVDAIEAGVDAHRRLRG